jgi:hypothetical protein
MEHVLLCGVFFVEKILEHYLESVFFGAHLSRFIIFQTLPGRKQCSLRIIRTLRKSYSCSVKLEHSNNVLWRLYGFTLYPDQ